MTTSPAITPTTSSTVSTTASTSTTVPASTAPSACTEATPAGAAAGADLRIRTFGAVLASTPAGFVDQVRSGLLPWDDPAHLPMLALAAFDRACGTCTVLTTRRLHSGVELVARHAGEYVTPAATVLLLARHATLTRGHAAPTGPPTRNDLAVPAALHHTVGPLITGAWDADHRDTLLITEDHWWSLRPDLHCPLPDPHRVTLPPPDTP